ncbi:hypothetical protein AB0B15_38390 [Streptomyces sp. NPDC045456]|uniref:hypothetical protein n=1 Tax=Streptomyces sp. NPDC045456 TaxID=3155254 RepID=UPI0033E47C25
MSTTGRTHTPPRSLILAAPVGTYVTLTRGPESGWTEAAILGAFLLALILWGPAVLRAGGKALATRKAEKKAAAKKESEQ